MKLTLENGWKFCMGEIKRWERVDHGICYMTTKAGYEAGDINVIRDGNPWQDIRLPHDWCCDILPSKDAHPSNGFKPRGTGWYYDEFMLPETEEGRNVLLEFEGVMGESVVYVNGVLAARNETGYTGFTFDISDYVLFGEKNTVIVSVDNTRWEGWWYEGAGIYRPVNLYIRGNMRFAHQGLFVRPVKESGIWRLCLSAEVESDTDSAFGIEARVISPAGAETARMSFGGEAAAFGTVTVKGDCAVTEPELWSPDEPRLYTVECRLVKDGVTVDTQTVRSGFRDIEWTDHGMFINGVLTPVHGICCHQDHAGAGIAIGSSVWRYRVAKLKAMGCNAYRCAHNCPSKELLDVCDEMGMLVMAENRHFRSSEEVMRQLDELARVSRNHPSVFLYSLFNEEPWQAEPRGRRIAERMLRRLRMSDDSRAVTAAMNGGALTKENASDVLDVAGFNYFIYDYMKYAERCPGKPMVATENGPLYATRGIYKDDREKQEYDAYGLTTAPFGQLLQDTVECVDAAPHVAGLFVWGGFDYRGEPQPFEWPSVFSHWGLTDNCGFEKDSFHMLKSYYDAAPMVHLLPHWNWTEGETVRVCAMTNCDTARLYVNGRPVGEKTVVRNRAEWEVPFEAGSITVEAEKDGKVFTDERKTAGAPALIEVADAADGKDYDCSIINVCLTDADGTPVPCRESDMTVTFDIVRGTLIGSGNGDPNGIRPDRAASLETFCGRCQALVMPDGEGRVDLTVRCGELPEVRYTRG